MKKEQFEKYRNLTSTIDNLDTFLKYCGSPYGDNRRADLIIHKKTKGYCMEFDYAGRYEVMLPKDLQAQIAEVINDYKVKLEKERDEL